MALQNIQGETVGNVFLSHLMQNNLWNLLTPELLDIRCSPYFTICERVNLKLSGMNPTERKKTVSLMRTDTKLHLYSKIKAGVVKETLRHDVDREIEREVFECPLSPEEIRDNGTSDLYTNMER